MWREGSPPGASPGEKGVGVLPCACVGGNGGGAARQVGPEVAPLLTLPGPGSAQGLQRGRGDEAMGGRSWGGEGGDGAGRKG